MPVSLHDDVETPGNPAPDTVQSADRVAYDRCPLCRSRDFAFLRADDCTRHPSWAPPLSPKMRWMSCTTCSHVFVEGPFTNATLETVFSVTQKNQAAGAGIEANRAISARMIEKVLPYRDAGAWLDVGFGNGSLMFTAQEFGFEVCGLDLRTVEVDRMKGFGFDARAVDLVEAGFEERFDVVSMADVLEHTPDPVAMLAAAHSALREGGVLFLSMPNADAFLWAAMTAQNANPYWAELEHYHNFGRKRLNALLIETGFTPVRFGISERYRCCMEVIARKPPAVVSGA